MPFPRQWFRALLLAAVMLVLVAREIVPTVAEGAPELGSIAYIQGGNLWVKDLPDGPARQLTRGGGIDTPRWSPSGEWIAFRAGGQLQVVRRAGTDLHVVETGPTGAFAWSPVTDSLAYITRGGLVVATADGARRREIIPPSNAVEAGVQSFAWSPDGSMLAFSDVTILQPAQNGQPPVRAARIVRVRADGSDTQEVYSAGRPASSGLLVAGWAPDGAFILFWTVPGFSASLLADGAPLLMVPAAGGTPVQLTGAMLAHPDLLDWSPASRQLAIVDGGGRETWSSKFIALGRPSAPLRRVTGPGQAVLFPSWSPDGRQIAFTSGSAAPGLPGGDPALRAMAGRRIWVMAADGSGQHPLTTDPRYRDEHPEWSANGRAILFARLEGDQASVWLMDADGAHPRRVIDELGPGPGVFGTYGLLDWGRFYDWTGRNRLHRPVPLLPATGGDPQALLLLATITGLAALAVGWHIRRRLAPR
ncbi:MAG: PD40 domain-containing protein [Chloroflexi bacterium]|nr:PD40 domain-containing protein [Chloroflexota bacterium]